MFFHLHRSDIIRSEIIRSDIIRSDQICMIDRSTETVNKPYLKGKSKHTEFAPGIFEKIKRNSTWQGESYLTFPFNLANNTIETIFKGEYPKHRISTWNF